MPITTPGPESVPGEVTLSPGQLNESRTGSIWNSSASWTSDAVLSGTMPGLERRRGFSAGGGYAPRCAS